MSVFDQTKKNYHLERNMFLDGSVDIQRFDHVRYKEFNELCETQYGFFWLPQEVEILKDANDFKNLPANEQHIFTSNLKRQILLDSVQGRAPAEAFMPFVSVPELEAWIMAWTFSETIHSRSYTYVIQNVYPDPSKVFDEVMDIQEIVECADDVSRDYDALVEYGQWYQLLGEGTHEINGRKTEISKYELKRLIWRALYASFALESVRFYCSFCTSWLPAEHSKVMEGNAKIIQLICRDENLHMGGTMMMLKNMARDDPDFARIQDEERDYVTKMMVDTIEQEKAWAEYLFKEGPMVGLNAETLNKYLEWLANDRMTKMGLKCPYKVERKNPLPWTKKWIRGDEVQPAPQETEITSYTISQVKQDVDDDTFSGMTL